MGIGSLAKWRYRIISERIASRGAHFGRNFKHRRKRKNWVAQFEERHDYVPNLEAPRKFSEKILRRRLDDDDPYYRLYGVKLFAPYFLRSRSIDGLRFPDVLNVVRYMQPSDFHDLPESFIIRSSFGSGLNEIVTQATRLDNKYINALCQRFNDGREKVTNSRRDTDLENCFIFEAFLGDPTQGPPDDYKFHCFHSADGTFTCFIQIDANRQADHRQTLFDQKFNMVDLQFNGRMPHDEPPSRPDNLPDLIRIAKEISAGFDYVRVDLFNTMDGVFFGEISPFHQDGMGRINPVEWEERLGALWDQRFPSFRPDKV